MWLEEELNQAKQEKKTSISLLSLASKLNVMDNIIGMKAQHKCTSKRSTKHFSTLAAPVLLGMILNEAALPPLQSLLDGPSTVF